MDGLTKIEIPQNEGEHINVINSYLGRFMQVHVSDGRIMEGRFRCFDKEKNIILSDTTEIKKVLPLENPNKEDVGEEPQEEDKKKGWNERKQQAEERFQDKKNGIERKKVGLVLIPGKDLVKCLLDEDSEPKEWTGRKRKVPDLPAEEKLEETEGAQENKSPGDK